jgi:UDP-glucuronate 4-epimerase
MNILITGTAGFIGFHLARRLLERGDTVTGVDNINDYYDVSLKYGRLRELGIEAEHAAPGEDLKSAKYDHHRFIRINIEDKPGLTRVFEEYAVDVVCNLAAQAGVRYSLKNPDAYMASNVMGFFNILECCRHNKVRHMVFASSSSVYGLNTHMPFRTSDNVDHPVSLYAASKKSNELMAHAYSHLYNIPTTGLRFFTVYGPWGRPDMAYFLFTRAILAGKPIDIYHQGQLHRDFTYIDDIIEGLVRVIDSTPRSSPKWDPMHPDPARSSAPYRIYNIGNNTSVRLMDFIEILEKSLGKEAKKNFLPMQPGDVYATYADVDDLIEDFGYKPSTPLEQGIESFVKWYRGYYENRR